MPYLSKKDADKIIKVLTNNPNKDIKNIINKLNSPKNKRVYVAGDSSIRKLLKKAFKEKRKVKMRYYSPHSDEHTTRIINIYQIYLNSIIAFCNLRGEERTFVVPRINSVAILEEKYFIPKGWKPESIILDK